MKLDPFTIRNVWNGKEELGLGKVLVGWKRTRGIEFFQFRAIIRLENGILFGRIKVSIGWVLDIVASVV